MFLDSIAQLGFFQHNPDEAALVEFPVHTRRIVAKEVTEVLLKGSQTYSATNFAALIRSQVHIHVLMELVGQSFSLPIDAADVIENATELYRRWLFEADLQTPAYKENEALFYMGILRHMSLLFNPRPGIAPGQVPVHAKLCATVLEIYRRVARETGKTMSVENWEMFIQIMLGICDNLLRRKVEEDALSDKLTPHLLKTLFEVFLLSTTVNDVLWDALKRLTLGWRHRKSTIIQWNAMCVGLTNRVLRLLYGPLVGADQIVFQSEEGAPVVLEFAPAYVHYIWGRILHLLADLESIPNAANYTEAMKGVQQLTNMLLALRPPAPAAASGADGGASLSVAAAAASAPFRPPDGNTIVQLVGHWLFEAINNYAQPGYERGKGLALEAVLALFCARPKCEFAPRYIAQLYRGLDEALRTRTAHLVAVLMLNSTTFFPCEFPGSRLLLPSYLYSAMRILLDATAPTQRAANTQLLRRSCLKVLSTVFCYPNQLRGLQFRRRSALKPEHAQFAALGELVSFQAVGEYVPPLLLEALRLEDDTENRQLLIWMTVCAALDNLHLNRDLPASLAALLADRMSRDWNFETTLTALHALQDLAAVYHLYRRANDELASTVVQALCRLIERQSAAGRKDVSDEVVAECLAAVLEWAMVGQQWLLRDARTLRAVLEVTDIGLWARKDTQTQGFAPPTPRVREAAEQLLLALLNQLGQFPAPGAGPTSMGSLAKEPDLLAADALTSKNIQCYVFDRTLLSVVSHPRRDGVEVTLVVRDQSGRYVWRTALNLFPPDTPPPPEPAAAPLQLPAVLPTQEVDEEFLGELFGFLDDHQRRVHDALLRQVQDRATAEVRHLKSNQYHLATDVVVKRPARPVPDSGAFDPVPGRLWLQHAGMLALENRAHFGLLQASAARPFNFLQNFRPLDGSNPRECHTIGVVFLGRGQARSELWSNEDGSAAWNDFLRGLGWEIEVRVHDGYLGGLDAAVTGEHALYWSNHAHEMIFHVAPLMPNGDPKQAQAHKKRLLQPNTVLVAWVEDLDDWAEGGGVLTSESHLQLIVHPLPSGLYRIRHIRRSSLPAYFGPLLHDMVVSKPLLPTAVRLTALLASRLLKNNHGSRSLTQRKLLLDDFVKKYQVPVNLPKVLGSQFAQL